MAVSRDEQAATRTASKALWHLNCATNLNPKFSEAMELRSQITGSEMTATDNSMIRSFVRKQIMNDRANPTTLPAAGR